MADKNPFFGEEIGKILANSLPDSRVTHMHTIPPRSASYAPWPEWATDAPWLKDIVDGNQLYTHQAQFAEAAFAGRDVIISTGTSSGKSLAYLLPVLCTLNADKHACAIYLSPTKSLGADQLRKLNRINAPGVVVAPYDGDTPAHTRSTIRNEARFVLSNPDMLHMILGNHEKWARLLRNLRFVIIDEAHVYRGLFGANVSWLIRRLLRVCRRYGSSPVLLFASATINGPAEHAERLGGRDVLAIEEDHSPQGPRTIMLWEPGLKDDQTGTPGVGELVSQRISASADAARLMATAVDEGARTLCFTRSRRQAEQVALHVQELTDAPVASYRAGYLPEERRALERALDEGQLMGVAATNALELGIDVGGLDVVVCAGYPGTVASFWQQAGRAGRRGQGSLVVLVARDDPMDMFMVHHPDRLLGTPVERSVFNPLNPFILKGHLWCAASEVPLSLEEAAEFPDVIDELAAEGLLVRRSRGVFAREPGAHGHVQMRGQSSQVLIVEDTGRVLGTVDSGRAPAQVHPGAVYVHRGETFVVDSLDLNEGLAMVHSQCPEWTTFARSTTDIRIIDPPEQISVSTPAPGVELACVNVEVTDRVVGYVRKLRDGSGVIPAPNGSQMIALDMPPSTVSTRAVVYTIDPGLLAELPDIPGALHAAEHAAIGLLPLIATCDRWDIGGVSTAVHADTGMPTVFVYDGHAGGAGFSDAGHERFREWISATLERVEHCDCSAGCPSCIQSPKCGNGNQPLHKAGAIFVLRLLLGLPATVPAKS